ncbi:hypothetical protein FHT40_000150 [Mycolicibacterium sp. BK556]|uniref:hypothetical protein n=1 Tax=Mycobacteriaceae TaxID=1762 RepID=UPI00105B4360|nr:MULTISPECIES: hypothetical protein [Mycobacteriaceae]MBB3600517.1 hypothetical protein [Mycolicibacterium sp. BK556]MBB3630270.1 hypothetical protein [Mycolicibacterium sp. BK607]MBB3748270.1 hypothetical protein [Mycolicibacterium sp. BK634]TDO10061.1 hypothetical protein EV580_4346 [Mycobacterium sp. BK086]
MLRALSLSGADAMSVPAPSARRVNKFLAAGAAMVTAGALAASPITPSLPAEIQQRAVELAAVANPIASPLTVYPEILTNTLTNLQNLGEAIAANPLPVLSQIASNQAGYFEDIFGGIAAIPTNWAKFSQGTGSGTSGGGTYLKNLQAALAAGDTTAAATAASSYLLFGLLATLQPIYSHLLTTTPRGSTVSTPGIPQEIAQNFANAIGVIFSSTTIVNGIFTAVYGGSLGTVFAVGETLGDVAKAVQSGDLGGAINGLINLPGITVDAFVNGWQHPSAQVAWPALLTYQNTGTYATTSIGLLGQLLVKIPAAIANAIKPATTTASVTTSAAAVTAAAETTSGTDSTTEATPESTESATTTAVTSESGSVSTPSASSAASNKSVKKTSSSSVKASDTTASSGTKKTAGSGHSARAKSSASKSSGSSD